MSKPAENMIKTLSVHKNGNSNELMLPDMVEATLFNTTTCEGRQASFFVARCIVPATSIYRIPFATAR
jgi:hypothetical protein